jgi:hypothetical protein
MKGLAGISGASVSAPRAMISSKAIPVPVGQEPHIQQLLDEHHHWRQLPLSMQASTEEE